MNRAQRRRAGIRRDPGGPPPAPLCHDVPVITDGAPPPCPHCGAHLWWLTQPEMVDLMVDLGRPPIEVPFGTRLMPLAYPWWFCWDCGNGGALVQEPERLAR